MKTSTLVSILLLLATASNADAAKLRGVKGSRKRDLQSNNMQSLLSSNMESAGSNQAGGASKASTPLIINSRQMMSWGTNNDFPSAAPSSDPVVAVPTAPLFGGGDLIVVADSQLAIEMTDTATYQVTFTNLWSATTHPPDYPSNAHWSPPVIVSHSADYEMWRSGMNATEGVASVAETGSTFKLFGEFDDAGESIGDSDLGTTQFNSQQPQELNVVVKSNNSLISSITMVVPSPDWFTGFYNLRPITVDGMWLKEFMIDTYPWDSGTDSGVTYTSANVATNPQDSILQITAETSPTESQVFVNTNVVEPVARWTFTLVQE